MKRTTLFTALLGAAFFVGVASCAEAKQNCDASTSKNCTEAKSCNAARTSKVAQAPENLQNIEGPGIVIAGSENASSLPAEAHKFLDKHFKGVTITKCQQYFAKGVYEVELSNGVDVEFDTKGAVREIDSPDRAMLATTVVKDVLPEKAYKYLKDAGLDGKVESIEYTRRGKNIEVDLAITGNDTYNFTSDGTFKSATD